jgi:hypothetical protein
MEQSFRQRTGDRELKRKTKDRKTRNRIKREGSNVRHLSIRYITNILFSKKNYTLTLARKHEIFFIPFQFKCYHF